MQIIPGQTGSDLLPPQIHLHQLWQGEAHIWRIFTGEMWVWVGNHQMWRAFAWGFDAVGVTHSAAQTPDQREASAINLCQVAPRGVPVLGQVSLSIVCSLNRVSCKGEGILSLAYFSLTI